MLQNAIKLIVNKIRPFTFSTIKYPACGRDTCYCLVSLDPKIKSDMKTYQSCYETWEHFFPDKNKFDINYTKK